MPTTALNTYGVNVCKPIHDPEMAFEEQQSVMFAPSLNLPAGQIVGQITATGKFADYASGHADGTQVAVGVLEHPVVTDASGNITNWSEFGATFLTAPIYLHGMFRTADTTGLDATALGSLQGRYYYGTTFFLF